ncbi:MAG TPA: PilZ domain-containing protein [Polyangia bacterium]
MRVVQVHLRDGPDFLGRYGRKREQDELFLAEALDCAVGEEVALDLYFDHSGYAFRLQARVISRRLSRAGNLPPGARVALLTSAEGLAPMIVSHARGDEIRYFPRTGARVDCAIPVKLRGAAASGRGEVVDLSPGGARLTGIAPPPLGALLALKLYPPGSVMGLALRGRVVWHRGAPDFAMGVQFQAPTARQARRLSDLLDRLARAPAGDGA